MIANGTQSLWGLKRGILANLVMLWMAFLLASQEVVAQRVTVVGSGASFPSSLYQQWSVQFEQTYADVEINYSPSRSAQGIVDVINRLTNFGGSDIPPTAAEAGNTTLITARSTAGMIVLAYNIPNLSSPLVLTRQNIADMFAGRITNWNDATLTSRNPALRDALRTVTTAQSAIQLVVRRPGSGTTYNFVTALKSFDPAFPSEISSTIDWKGMMSNGTRDVYEASTNEALGSVVSTVPYTLTYMDGHEARVANNVTSGKIGIASVVNRNGDVAAPLPAAMEAAQSGLAPGQFIQPIDSPAAGAYPITVHTHFGWMNIKRIDCSEREASLAVDPKNVLSIVILAFGLLSLLIVVPEVLLVDIGGMRVGMLLLKSYRIWIIFDYQKTSHAISDLALIIGACIFALLNLILISVQTILTVPGPISDVSPQGTQLRSCKPKDGQDKVHNILEYTVLSYNALLIMSCVFFSFKTRRAYARFAESKSIAVGVGVVAITFIFGIPVMASVNDLDNGKGKNISSFIRGMIFIVSSVAVAIALFVPRLSEVIHEKKNKLAMTVAELRSQAGGSGMDGGPGGMGFGQVESTFDSTGMFRGGTSSGSTESPRAMTYRVRIEGTTYSDGTVVVMPDQDEMVLLPEKVAEGKSAERIKLSASTYRFPTVQQLPNLTERERIAASRVNVHLKEGRTLVLEFESVDKLRAFKAVLESASFGSHPSLLRGKTQRKNSISKDSRSGSIYLQNTNSSTTLTSSVPQLGRAPSIKSDYGPKTPEVHPLNLMPINPAHASYFGNGNASVPPSPTETYSIKDSHSSTAHLNPALAAIQLQSVPPSPQLSARHNNSAPSPRSIPMQNRAHFGENPTSPRAPLSPRLPPAYISPSPKLAGGGHNRIPSGGYHLDAMPGAQVVSINPMNSTGLGAKDSREGSEVGERRYQL
ncbi:hypothetical protein HK097_010787 [Rhizophlyctis rosea]|uniref:G-protein coupled receptors family 3 profile domain-containing protein n=1 Tax=Rhizophlyctis rosea TaxID=64517 RepID=A0AAD5SF26_9FUNG|nr:hypothetical protein HK097_010787 [Rhizophlyctis rosea]